MKNNHELKILRDADQMDRMHFSSGELTELELWRRDYKRLSRVVEIMNEGGIKTSMDCQNAACVFQHGRNAENERDSFASGLAVKMMEKAIELDPLTNKWLLAAAIDRDLMIRKKPQIYGTQYIRENKNAPWTFYELDPTKISDEERKEYNVETLDEQKEMLIMMNKKQLLNLYLELNDINQVINLCKNDNSIKSEYNLSQNGINSFGYQLMKKKEYEKALKVFQLNTEFYPKEFDTYHGLGDCLVRLGRKKEAILAFEKSLELNPNFGEAKKDLALLKKEG